MSPRLDSRPAAHMALGLLATISMSWVASAAEQPSKPLKWETSPPDAAAPIPPTPPANSNLLDGATVIEGDALSESELKWSFITWVNTLANSKPQEAVSMISKTLDVDSATATHLINFGSEASSRLGKFTSDLTVGLCKSLRVAKTEHAFQTAFDAQSLQWDRKRAEIIGDLDSSFAGATAAKIHTWIETSARPNEKQINLDWHRMLATPEARQGVVDRACGPAVK
jgi:hypothetical protein